MKKITKVDNIENTVRKGEKMKEKVISILIISFVLQYVCFFTQTFAINQTISQDIENIDSNTYPQIKEMIQNLKNEHQNWNFKILYTDLDWNEVIENEYVGHGSSPRNLVPTSSSYAGEWICPICGDTTYDSGKWHCASQSALKYMMDPRNSLNSSDIFQFLELTYTDYKIETIQAMLKKYDFWNNESYINAIIEASKKYNVNVYYVIARILQEQGNGTSPLVKGEGYNDQYIGVYNVFNIGASGSGKDNVILNGLARAEQEGWTSIELSIDGGVEFISRGYINRGQNTMYLQKFDVDSSEAGLYWHQYQQNIMAPQNEGTKLRVAFEECESLDMDYTFIIPVYKNMPDTAYERPSTDNKETPEINSNLVKCNANPSLRLRDNPNGTYIGEKIYLNEIVTVIEKATEKVAGTYWDFVRKSNGVEGYAARSTSDDEPVYKLYLVPIKEDDNGNNVPDKPTPDVPDNSDDENKEIVENEKLRINNTTNEITSIPNSTIADLKELLGAEIVVKNSNGEVVSDESNLATGYVVNDKYTISVLGDVGGDGVVNSADLLSIQKDLLKVKEIDIQCRKKSADVNQDGVINSADLLKIQKQLLGVSNIEI